MFKPSKPMAASLGTFLVAALLPFATVTPAQAHAASPHKHCPAGKQVMIRYKTKGYVALWVWASSHHSYSSFPTRETQSPGIKSYMTGLGTAYWGHSGTAESARNVIWSEAVCTSAW